MFYDLMKMCRRTDKLRDNSPFLIITSKMTPFNLSEITVYLNDETNVHHAVGIKV